MNKKLPKIEMPAWLKCDKNELSQIPFPLKEVLDDSLYYPSSRFDGDPVKYLSGNIYSFVYVDYGVERNELEEEIIRYGFRGYHRILSRDVTEQELTPNGWEPFTPSRHDGNPKEYEWWRKTPFATWSVFQRNDGFDDGHGVQRFSLLYLCADGVAAFQALYISNSCFPLAITIIQPGEALGGNWTYFAGPEKILARTVLTYNPAGKPKILLYGGIREGDFYKEPCWPQFSEHVCFLEKSGGGRIGVWQKAPDKTPGFFIGSAAY